MAVGAIQGIARTIGEVSQIAAAIAAAVDGQSVTARQIVQSVREVAHGNQQMTELMADIKDETSGTVVVAGRLTDAADALGIQSTALRDAVASFLSKVRAA